MRAQPARSRDVGFAIVRYDNGRTFAATTLNETAVVERATGTLVANGLVSLFNDGRWSMQGLLAGTRTSSPLSLSGPLKRSFDTVRGELGLVGQTTAQHGFMPTLQLTGQSRLHLERASYATRVGAALSRTFDGVGWRTTVLGEAGGWWRLSPRTVLSVTSTPMQLQFGDLLGDNEAAIAWTRGRTEWSAMAGTRLGRAGERVIGWGSLTATVPILPSLVASFSAGSYPEDLIQGLPGGRYAAFAVRVPEAKWSALRRPPAPAPRRAPPPEVQELPVHLPLALVIGPALDSLGIREIRVWAPGVRVVEVLADFFDWLPAPLIKQPNGEWRGYYYITAGLHRLNLRLDGHEVAVPANLPRSRDDFLGEVGVVVVR